MGQNATRSAVDTPSIGESVPPVKTHSQKHFRLLDLPRELRDHIYDLVMSHGQINWEVKPNQDMPLTTTIAGQECRPEYLDRILVLPQYEPISHQEMIAIGQHYQHGDDLLELVALFKPATVEKSSDMSESSAASSAPSAQDMEVRHVCSMKCLRQPALSKVNRKLRDETLPLFYGKHVFVLHEHDFNDVGSDYGRIEAILPAAPVRWWDDVGDTNLRLVKKLVILYREPAGTDGVREPGFAFFFHGSRDGNAVHITWRGVTRSVEEWRDGHEGEIQREVLEHGLQIQQKGLFAEALEVITRAGIGDSPFQTAW